MSAEQATAPAGPRIDALTGLRAVAAATVLAFHIRGLAGDELDVLFDRFYLGVDLFFVLSGYVISLVHFDEFAAGSGRYRRFIALRLGRIWPAYLVVLLAALLGLATFEVLGMPHNEASHYGLATYVVAYALMVQGWGWFELYDFNPTAWSVSVEWACYLAFPLFVLAVRPLRGVAVLALVALAVFAVVFAAFQAVGAQGLTDVHRAAVPRAMLGFVMGMLMWRLNVAGALSPRAAGILSDGMGPLLLTLLLAGALLPAWFDFVLLGGFVLLILGLGQGRGVLAAMLSRPLAVYLGEISYSFYLVHWLAIAVLLRLWEALLGKPEQVLERLALAMIVIVSSLIAAIALHHLVERPARLAVRRRLLGRE